MKGETEPGRRWVPPSGVVLSERVIVFREKKAERVAGLRKAKRQNEIEEEASRVGKVFSLHVRGARGKSP